jgi:hypothetical protein
VGRIEKRADRNDRLEQIAFTISKQTKMTAKQRAELWRKQTGLGMTIYYRHLKVGLANGEKVK